MALTDTAIRLAKPAKKNYSLSDGEGLSLFVGANGAKLWHFRFSWLGGTQPRISFGAYPDISLKQARQLRDEARALVAQGVDPRQHRQQRRRAASLAVEHTFKAVFERWVEFRRHSLKEGRQTTLAQLQRIFGKDVLPYLAKRPIYDIKRADLLAVLARIERRKALTIAEKCRTWFNQLFRYALVAVEGMEQNPAADLDVVALPKPPVSHHPFLRMAELPALLAKLRQYRGNLQTQLGLRLMLLTGVRTGELRAATPDQFDLERAVWTIPPEAVKQLQLEMRKKGKRPQDLPPYIVPLSLQALEVARHLLAQVLPAQRYLFAHRSDLKKRISENTLNGALRRLGYADQLTGHGMRATLSTALHEIGYPKPWVDAQLSHADPDKVSAAYNHAEYVEQRRAMMQDWADRLDLMEQGQMDAATRRVTVHLEGTATLPLDAEVRPAPVGPTPDGAGPMVHVVPSAAASGEGVLGRLPAIPVPTMSGPAQAPLASDLQRERQEMLAIYEAPSNLPVPVFAKLVGKSRDQINRDIKARRLLSLGFGNRGQRIPDWQLDPVRHRLTMLVLQQAKEWDAWKLYRTLSRPSERLQGQSPIEAVTVDTLSQTIQVVVPAGR